MFTVRRSMQLDQRIGTSEKVREEDVRKQTGRGRRQSWDRGIWRCTTIFVCTINHNDGALGINI